MHFNLVLFKIYSEPLKHACTLILQMSFWMALQFYWKSSWCTVPEFFWDGGQNSQNVFLKTCCKMSIAHNCIYLASSNLNSSNASWWNLLWFLFVLSNTQWNMNFDEAFSFVYRSVNGSISTRLQSFSFAMRTFCFQGWF